MADLNRPDYGQVWASTGEKVAPDTVKMQSGWVQEMMPFQYENYLQARQDEAIVYLLQKGIPEYSSTQEYIANKSVVVYQGNLYMATATVTNVLPTVTASWKRLNVPLTANAAVPLSSGGTGATTASEARTNLGLGSIATSTAPVTNGIVVKDANDSLVARLITGTSGNITITNPDGVAGNININVGSNVAQLSQDPSWTSKGGIRLPSGSTGERGTEVAGKIRYNTTLQKFEGFDGTSWNALGASSNIEITTLSGNGVTTNFTLNSDVFSAVATDVYIGGIYQSKASYSVSGSTITFSEAPVAGVDNIQVLSRRVVDLGLSTATQVSIQDTTNLYTSSTVEGALREVGDKAKYVKNAILSFPDYSAASAAAATLPDGQAVSADGSDYVVVSGAIVSQRPTASVAEVGTIAELRALPAPLKKCAIYVRGYHSENDGGGGHFLWVPASSKVDNGGNVIAPNSAPVNGRWEWEGVADVRRFGAQLNNGDSTLAIRAALKTGKKVLFSGVGDYFVSGELEVTHAGQVIEWEQTGGYGYGVGWATGWEPRTRLVAIGTFTKRIRTRRLHRANALAAEDAPLSVVFNVQAEGVYFSKPSIFLQCDYSDSSPTNEGADCDVAIFVASRVGIQIHDPQIIGYFRSAGILFDVTGSFNLPRFPSLDGTPYNQGTVRNGGDGTHIFNPYIHGSRRAVAVMGANPAPGYTTYGPDYVDAVSGSTVTDGRGNVGFSDFLCIGGRLYGPDHHSGWRRKDPILSGGVLNASTMLAEPDDAPAVMHIDGLAANSSSNLWGMRFIGTRFATFEMFRIRLDKASRISLINCHIEGRGGAGLSATGQVIDSNNTVTTSYGDIAGTANTDRVMSVGSLRQAPEDSHLVHYYGQTATMETESGRYYLDGAGFVQARSGYLELRGAPSQGVRFRAGDTTLGAISQTDFTLASGVLRSTGTELDLRSTTGSVIRFRSGSATVGTVGDSGAAFVSTIRHTTDNLSAYGAPANRGTTIYLGSNPVVTSDEREKQQIRELVEAERRVGVRLKGLIRAFKYNDAVVLKGDGARIHVGWIAQEVKAAFEADGLDGFDYACLCYDEWDEQPEQQDDEGNVIQQRQEAGNRYGVRESQILTFIISAL